MARRIRRQSPRKERQIRPQSEILRARAERCRKLADAVGDLEFAIRLHALSEEYDRRASRADIGVADGAENARVHWRWSTLMKNECRTTS